MNALTDTSVAAAGNDLRVAFREAFARVDFTEALRAVEAERQAIDMAIARLHSWPTVERRGYEVVLTPYGMGGSYNASAARVTLKVPANGQWSRPPSHGIIHEILHICAEMSLVQPYNLTQGEKEAMIDQLILRHFGDLLPNYTVQKVRDSRIDAYLATSSVSDLEAAVAAYTRDHPRLVQL